VIMKVDFHICCVVAGRAEASGRDDTTLASKPESSMSSVSSEGGRLERCRIVPDEESRMM